MQPLRRGVALLAPLCALALAGCHHGASDGGGQETLSGSSPVATVNGQPVSREVFFSQLQGYRPTQQTLGLPAGQTVLRQLINGLLVEQLAQQQGVAPTDAQVNALYATQQASTEAQSVKTFDQLLAESGFTAQDVKDYTIRPQLATIDLIEKGQPAVTDAEINAYYAKNTVSQFTEPDRAHIKRLILASAADAQRIYSQIQKGQSFDSFVSQSVDQSLPDGDVPYWVNLDTPPNPQLVPPAMLPALKKAAAAEKASGPGPASVTPPYASPNGVWIVQVVDQKPKTVIPLDQVKEFIRFTLMAQRVRQNPSSAAALQQQLATFQSQAKITIPDPRYAQLLAALTAPPPPTPSLSLPGSPAPGASAAPAPAPGG